MMMHTMFANAVEDLRTQNAIGKHAAEMLVRAQKFYLPQAVNVLEGKPYATVKDLLRLPYPIIAVLSEATLIDDSPQGMPGQQIKTISIAVSPDLAIAEGREPPEAAWACVTSLVYLPSVKSWTAMDLGVWCCTSEDGHQIRYPVKTAGLRSLVSQMGWSTERAMQELNNDISTTETLCVMLGMKNVRATAKPSPTALSKARQRRGRLPLWDYHVLTVDGETWDGPALPSAGGGAGFRSHLRRGHIRRLDDTRRVWVRASFVHGRVDEFVDKDYRVAQRPLEESESVRNDHPV